MPGLRNVGGEDVVKAAVFANDDDDVLDRREVVLPSGLPLVDGPCVGCAGQRSANRELKECNGCKSKAHRFRRVGCKILKMHSSSLIYCGAYCGAH